MEYMVPHVSDTMSRGMSPCNVTESESAVVMWMLACSHSKTSKPKENDYVDPHIPKRETNIVRMSEIRMLPLTVACARLLALPTFYIHVSNSNI
jgi:hypothetical protein